MQNLLNQHYNNLSTSANNNHPNYSLMHLQQQHSSINNNN
jgi:hypothetical protein